MHYGFEFTREEARKSHPDTIDVIQCDRSDVATYIQDVDVVVPLMTDVTRDLLHKAKRLKLVIQYGAGVEKIDREAATELGIYVSNIPSKDTGNAASCSEMAILLMLACLRKWKEMQESIQQERLGVPVGEMLYGKTVLVIGFGNIAKNLVVRLSCFGVRTYVIRRQASDHNSIVDDAMHMHATRCVDKMGTWDDSKVVLAEADIIVLACASNETNRDMVDKEFLEQCKDGVVLVNVSRGQLMHYEDITYGLQSGKIGGLGLDVQFWEPFDPEDPIAKHPSVVLTPHVAGVTTVSYRNMAKIVVEETMRIRNKQSPSIQLNTPSINRFLQ